MFLQPVSLSLELNQGGKNTVGIVDSFCGFRVLMLEVLIGPLSQFGMISNFGGYFAPNTLIALFHTDNSGNSDFIVHRNTKNVRLFVVLTGLQNVIKSHDVN